MIIPDARLAVVVGHNPFKITQSVARLKKFKSLSE
jgi:hypothetical protein